MIKAISQLLCPDKDREEWFSLGENHEKLLDFALHQLRNRYSQTRPQPRRESSRIVAVTVACGMVTLP